MIRVKSAFKILTEGSKAPPRAVALASYLGDGYSALGARAPPAKDLMAFGSVLQHTQHNIGMHFLINCENSKSQDNTEFKWLLKYN